MTTLSKTDLSPVDFTALVRDVLGSALEIDPTPAAFPLDAQLIALPNMSSLAMVRGLVLLEAALGMELDDDQIVTASTVGELVTAVERQAQGG